MKSRVERLESLLTLQRKIKALHETRHAGHLAAALQARDEAVEIAARFDAEDSMAGLFPEVYHRRVQAAVTREQHNLEMAALEARKVAEATLRTDRVERAFRDERAREDRRKGDAELLELIGQRLPMAK